MSGGAPPVDPELSRAVKRRHLDDHSFVDVKSEFGHRGRVLKSFGKFHAAGTYVADTVSTPEDTLYVPASTDIFVNFSAYDQITSVPTKFHVGDSNGRWVTCVMGHVINFWRYDMQNKRLFIAYSLAFRNSEDHGRAMEDIENMA